MGMNAFGQLQRIKMGTGSNTGTGDSWPTAWRKADKVIELVNWNRLYTIDATELAVLNNASVKPKEFQMVAGVDTTLTIQAQLDGKVDTTILASLLMVSDTAAMLNPYAKLSDLTEGGISLDAVQEEIADSLNTMRAAIVMVADTSAMLNNYTRNGELNEALANYMAEADTASMLANYALLSELGEAGISLDAVQNEIADSLNTLRPLIVMVADTAAMLDSYAKLSDLTEGGISIGAVQEEIADSLNMLRPLVVMVADTATMLQNYAKLSDITEGGISLDAVQDEIADSLNTLRPLVVMVTDTATMLGNYTRNGELNAALANYLAEADTATMLGNYTRNGELNTALGSYLAEADTATMLGNYARNGEVAASYAPKDSPVFTTQSTMPAITYFPSGSIISWSSGDVTATHSTNKLTFAGGNVSLGPNNLELTGTVGTITDRALYGYFTYLDMTNSPTIGGIDWYTLTGGQIQDSLDARIGAGIELGDVAVLKADSLTDYVTPSQLSDSLANFSGGISEGYVAGMINDSIVARLSAAVEGVRLADSLTQYVTPSQLVDSLDAFEGGGGVSIETVRGEISDSIAALIEDGLELSDILSVLDSDTIPLFIFGAGSGFSADTALFNNNRLAGAFYNSGSDTLYVTELRGVLVEGTGTETIDVQVSWDANMKDGTPTNLNTSPLTVTSMTTGTSDTTFDNNGIPPGVWVWCTMTGASSGNKPTMLILTMTGFKRNRSY